MKRKYVGFVLLMLLAAIFCIRQIGEPDVWWQMRTGDYILKHGEVPKVDVFSYTYNGDPWFNVKWGTEVIMAEIGNHLGPEFLMLLQFVVLCGILLLLYKIYRELSFSITGKKMKPGVGLMLALLVFLVGMSFRLNGRPEMMSHLMTCLFIYIFLLDWNYKGRWLFWLIPLQMLWANLHEGYGVGYALLIIYNFSIWIGYYQDKLNRKAALKNMQRVLLISILAILSVAIHPMGWKMIGHPLNIFGQLESNNFTTELWNFKHKDYWHLPAYISLFIFTGLLWKSFSKDGKKRVFNAIPRFYILIFLALTYLALQAYRNLPFFLFVATPLLGIYLQQSFTDKKWVFGLYTAIVILLYVSIGSGRFYDTFLPREKYGLRVDIVRNPIGAARFLKENHVQGKGFVDYFSSSFFMWYMPDFKSYLDMRDLDIFEQNFISNNMMAYVNPEMPTKFNKPLFEYMQELDNFNYVAMVNNIKFRNFHVYMNQNKDYTLVYADPNNDIFLRNNETNKALIEKYGKLPLAEKYHYYGKLKTPAFARAISKIFWPPYHEDYNISLTAEYRQVYKRQFMK